MMFDIRNNPILDSINVGDNKEEKEHNYVIEEQTWKGTRTFSYPNLIGNKDGGRSFKGYEEFAVRTSPNEDLLIIKRFDAGIGNQTVKVYVLANNRDKYYVGDWSFHKKIGGHRWLEDCFIIPAKYLNDQKVTLRFSYKYNGSGINSFYYWFYSLKKEQSYIFSKVVNNVKCSRK